jgi:hypothetical protein
MTGYNSAAAVPEVVTTTTGEIVCFAIPNAKKPEALSSIIT